MRQYRARKQRTLEAVAALTPRPAANHANATKMKKKSAISACISRVLTSAVDASTTLCSVQRYQACQVTIIQTSQVLC